MNRKSPKTGNVCVCEREKEGHDWDDINVN